MTITLVRVAYGKKGQDVGLREYRKDGVGPVGFLSDFGVHFPGETFIIKDHIDG